MKELRALNLEGNPIAQRKIKDVPFRKYIAAVLPILKYYNYIFIYDEERSAGIKNFK